MNLKPWQLDANTTFDQLEMIKRVKGMTSREVIEWIAKSCSKGWLYTSNTRAEDRQSHALGAVLSFRRECSIDDYLDCGPTIKRSRGGEPTRQLRVDVGQAAYWRLIREAYQRGCSLSALITELLMKQGSEKALKGRLRRNETAKAKRADSRCRTGISEDVGA